MIETKSYAIVIGCGEKGAAWIAKNHNYAQHVIGLDLKQPKEKNIPLIIGDVFNLPIRNGSLDQIHADFIVNGLIDREIAAPQIAQDPNILDSNYFPELFRRLFVESMSISHDSVRKNIKEVSTLLKTAALREMWRVLANNGQLQILDFEYNINWISHYAPQIVDENPRFIKLETMRVSAEDFERSESLGKVSKGRTHVQKIELIKKYPAFGTKLPLAGSLII